MTEKFSFFDPVLDDLGQRDREYNAQEFTDYFRTLVTTGIIKVTNQEPLKVSLDSGNQMGVSVATGNAFIEGRYYWNDDTLTHVLDTEVLGRDRIDRIVVRLDTRPDARYVRSFVKKGVSAASPVAPALTRDGSVYEISLAQIKVIGGQTFITAPNITDERGHTTLSPWAGSNILPNLSDSSAGQPNGLATLGPDGKVPQAQLSIVDASISAKGIVMLENAISSDRQDRAPTSWALNYLRGQTMPITGGNFTGPVTLNGKPLGEEHVDARTSQVTIFVSASSGNDANDGSQSYLAVKTFDKAVKLLKKINFGVRQIFLVDLVDLSPSANNGIDYREFDFRDYLGGEIILNFNNTGTKMSPKFTNVAAKVSLLNGMSYEKTPDGYGGGTQTTFNNVTEIRMENWTINRSGYSNNYSGIYISNCQWALIYLCKFHNIGSRLISIRDKSNVYVSSPSGTGNSGTHWGADYGSTIGGILNGMPATTDLGQGSQSFW